MNIAELPRKYRQSVWLDYIQRRMLENGEFARMVEQDGVTGITSNPSIFEKAIAGSTDYLADLKQLEDLPGRTTTSIYETMAVADIQEAADILRPVYEATERQDGFVSMEVSPHLAHDTRATVEEARRLWKVVDRENLMIKVPGTPEGVPAIRALIGEGINVNVTLLFSRTAYQQAADAHIAGLETLAARGGDVRQAAGVASFFVSRIDTAVDRMLEERMAGASSMDQAALSGLIGKTAIANAKLAYEDWKALHAGSRWLALKKQGARPQRLLWASTSSKNPKFRDVLYVEELIGPDTVDTIPPATLEAFRDHGTGANRLESGVQEAKASLAALEQLGISLEDVTRRLLEEGVRAFSSSFDTLMDSIEKRRKIAAEKT